MFLIQNTKQWMIILNITYYGPAELRDQCTAVSGVRLEGDVDSGTRSLLGVETGGLWTELELEKELALLSRRDLLSGDGDGAGQLQMFAGCLVTDIH